MKIPGKWFCPELKKVNAHTGRRLQQLHPTAEASGRAPGGDHRRDSAAAEAAWLPASASWNQVARGREQGGLCHHQGANTHPLGCAAPSTSRCVPAD